MAHSHDQTLLARLGFQDPDRKTPDHDLACRYLSQREQLRKIVALYSPFDVSWRDNNGKVKMTTFDRCYEGVAVLEEPLTKGIGQYKTHIGFLDISATFKFVDGIKDEQGNRKDGKDRQHVKVIIEVKIQPIDISAILRQLNLYKEHIEHSRFTHWLLVTAFPLNIEEVKSLSNVKHVYLNPVYKDYAEQPKAESQTI